MDDRVDFPRDEDGRIVGFQVGKAHNLAEWHHRKEQREAHQLFRRVIQRNSAARRRAQDPERFRAASRRCYARKRAAEDRTKLCEQCGVQWEPKKRWARFCSRACRNAHHTPRRHTPRHPQSPCRGCGALHDARASLCTRCQR